MLTHFSVFFLVLASCQKVLSYSSSLGIGAFYMFVPVLAALAAGAAARLLSDCALPPSNGFISAQQMDFVCEHRRHWMMERDSLDSWKDTTSKAPLLLFSPRLPILSVY